MKKFLSILIAITMIIAMIPTVFASETEEAYTKEYGFTRGALTGTDSGKNFLSTVTDYDTYRDTYNNANTLHTKNHGWKFFGYSGELDTTKESNTASTTRIGSVHSLSSGGLNFKMYGANIETGNFALALQAPASDKGGVYVPSIYWGSGNSSSSFSWYMGPKVSDKTFDDENDEYYMAPDNLIGEPELANAGNTTFTSEKAIYVSGDEDIIVAFGLKIKNYNFYNITLAEVQDAKLHISADKTVLDTTANKTATITSAVTGTNLDKPMDIAGGFVKYIVEQNEEQPVITFDAATGTITAVAPGTAKITAKSPDSVVNSVETITITVTAPEPEDEVAKETVSFAQTTNIDGFKDIAVTTVNRGDLVALTAHKGIDGYKFVGWKRGADTSDKNAWVDITGDTYSVWTNTYLTAVYEPVTAEGEKAVAFWNQNGAYIGKMDEATYNKQETLFTPKLTGFGTFIGWLTDGNAPFTAKQTLAAGTTNAVAKYEASAISDVTFNGSAIAGADKYNADITLLATSDATTCWKRDDEIIAYGSSYKFNVWDATNITEGTEEITDKVPVAILDYSEKHKAYMLEYDAGDYEIVEAGIIFGKDTADIKTYTSQRKEKHNQFTVPEEGELDATGYIIYTLDNGASYKTKYVSVKAAD
ncbi:MAG: hypothetical protein IJP38_00895 [Oscillospiraceae bacterium]|nr:hypothetical protein [Oscillospiraceae bacterium]